MSGIFRFCVLNWTFYRYMAKHFILGTYIVKAYFATIFYDFSQSNIYSYVTPIHGITYVTPIYGITYVTPDLIIA
jgi:hypothetical protein